MAVASHLISTYHAWHRSAMYERPLIFGNLTSAGGLDYIPTRLLGFRLEVPNQRFSAARRS
jgi:hypothetical protein